MAEDKKQEASWFTLLAVEDEVLADVRVDEVEAVVVAFVPVNPDFAAGNARGNGLLESGELDFVAEVVVVGALVNLQRQRRRVRVGGVPVVGVKVFGQGDVREVFVVPRGANEAEPRRKRRGAVVTAGMAARVMDGEGAAEAVTHDAAAGGDSEMSAHHRRQFVLQVGGDRLMFACVLVGAGDVVALIDVEQVRDDEEGVVAVGIALVVALAGDEASVGLQPRQVVKRGAGAFFEERGDGQIDGHFERAVQGVGVVAVQALFAFEAGVCSKKFERVHGVVRLRGIGRII